jgi:hypothetical protein
MQMASLDDEHECLPEKGAPESVVGDCRELNDAGVFQRRSGTVYRALARAKGSER